MSVVTLDIYVHSSCTKKNVKAKKMRAICWESAAICLFTILRPYGASAADSQGVHWPEPKKRATISAPFNGVNITLGLSSRTASAIDSAIWGKKQFVNNNDHGREIQSAATFDSKGECLNPTEAGSARDGVGAESSSQLLSLSLSSNQVRTTTEMAYWLGPGEQSTNCKGTISTVPTLLSGDKLSKVVTIGSRGVPNAISFAVTFSIPKERSTANFEALTGYMPPEFDRFWSYDLVRDSLVPQSDGPGTQTTPLIFSTRDEKFALGVYAPEMGGVSGVYGRWKFLDKGMKSPTVKWNCIFPVKNVAAGDHKYVCYIVIGNIEDVKAGLRSLRK